MDDKISKLKSLAELRDSGILSEAEFNAEKAKIMSGPAAPQQSYGAPQQTHVNQSTVILGNKQPDVLVAYLFWFFLGILGVHHLYMGRGVGIWLLALITLQGFGILWLVDLFLIPQSCSKIRSQTVIIR